MAPRSGAGVSRQPSNAALAAASDADKSPSLKPSGGSSLSEAMAKYLRFMSVYLLALTTADGEAWDPLEHLRVRLHGVRLQLRTSQGLLRRRHRRPMRRE